MSARQGEDRGRHSRQQSDDSGALVVMGVAGSGKSAVGESLAERIGAAFLDADDVHPRANIEKMARGEPLNDDDREPWIVALCARIGDHLGRGEALVLACSALRCAHRDRFRGAGLSGFVFLNAPEPVLLERLTQRETSGGHFMGAKMLRSQLDTLETPGDDEPDVVAVDVSPPLDVVVEHAIRACRTLTSQDRP